MKNDAPRSESLPAGYDEDDPYENKNIEEFPLWWRESIELFREHELRPYRPPLFSDGTPTPEVIPELEEDLGVSIQFKAVNPRFGDDWGIWINGEKISEIPRKRTEEARSVYEISSDLFKETVREAVSEKGDAESDPRRDD